MLRQSPRRKQRNNKGIKVKHVMQICMVLGVCIWLLYRLPRSSSSQESINKINNIKLGRKDLHPRTTAEENENKQGKEEENGNKEIEDDKVDEREGKEREDEENVDDNNIANEAGNEEKFDQKNDDENKSEGENENQSEEKASEDAQEQEEKMEDGSIDGSSSAEVDKEENNENQNDRSDPTNGNHESGPDYDSSPAESGAVEAQNDKSNTTRDAENDIEKPAANDSDEKRTSLNNTNGGDIGQSRLEKSSDISGSSNEEVVPNERADDQAQEERDLDTLPESGGSEEANNADSNLMCFLHPQFLLSNFFGSLLF